MLTLKKKASGKGLLFAYLEFRGQKPEFRGSNKLGLVTRLCTPIKDPRDAVMIKGEFPNRATWGRGPDRHRVQ